MQLLTAPLPQRLAERQKRRGTFQAPDGSQTTLGSRACAYAAYRWVSVWTQENERVWATYQSQRRRAQAAGVRYPEHLVEKYKGIMAGIQQQWVAALRIAADMYERNRMPASEVPPRTMRIAAIRDAVSGQIQLRMDSIAGWRRAADRIESEVNGYLNSLPQKPGGAQVLDYTKSTAPSVSKMGVPVAALAPHVIRIVGWLVAGAVIAYIARYTVDAISAAFGVNQQALRDANRNAQQAFDRMMRDCEQVQDRENRAKCIENALQVYTDTLADANAAAGGSPFAGAAMTLTLGALAVGGLLVYRATKD